MLCVILDGRVNFPERYGGISGVVLIFVLSKVVLALRRASTWELTEGNPPFLLRNDVNSSYFQDSSEPILRHYENVFSSPALVSLLDGNRWTRGRGDNIRLVQFFLFRIIPRGFDCRDLRLP